MKDRIIGYKVFESNWVCIDFKYEVGKTYHLDEEVELRERGFHFCQRLTDCYRYYTFNPNNRAAVVAASGTIIIEEYQCCTDTISIIRELSWGEILSIIDTELSGGKPRTVDYYRNHHT